MLNDVKEEFDIPSMEEFYGVDDEMIFDFGHSKKADSRNCPPYTPHF